MSPEGEEASHSPSDDLQAGDQALAPTSPASPGSLRPSLLFFRVALYRRLFNSAAFFGRGGLVGGRVTLRHGWRKGMVVLNVNLSLVLYEEPQLDRLIFSPLCQQQDKQILTHTGFQLLRHLSNPFTYHTHVHTGVQPPPPVAAFSEDP